MEFLLLFFLFLSFSFSLFLSSFLNDTTIFFFVVVGGPLTWSNTNGGETAVPHLHVNPADVQSIYIDSERVHLQDGQIQHRLTMAAAFDGDIKVES